MRKKIVNKKNVSLDLPGKDEIVSLIRAQKRPMRLDALLRMCGIKRNCKKDFEQLLRELEGSGKLIRMPGGKWAIPENLRQVTGQFFAKANGSGVLVAENGEEFNIHPLHRGDALHKDIVLALVLPSSGEPHGKIVEVIEKERKEIVARVDRRQGKFILCHPVDRKIPIGLSVRIEDFPSLGKTIRPDALLLVKPSRRIDNDLWDARLLNIFGSESRIDVQEAIVKCNHHAPDEFPQLALSQAQALEKESMPHDAREDWRHLPFVTIDGRDARDFDDAIHVEKESDGWILRVAIADVSHYVQPDQTPGSLDAEARKRGNSWYFPRSVEPMLPEILSNGLCSLRPGEDRLAMMAEIGFSQDGLPIKSRFAPVLMRSAARLVYEDVAEFFAQGSALPGDPGGVAAPMLLEAFNLYRLLAKQRRQRGSLDFDLPEPEYQFDKEGNLAEMGIASRTDANCLIEEFMIAANEAVARFIGSTPVPFLYRVHPEPESQKLGSLLETIKLAGLGTKLPAEIGPGDIRKILREAAGTPQEYTVNRLCLRAMQQARYQTENIGHFGLASLAYCHFTSPIRRYADLLVHRSLKKCLGLACEKLPTRDEMDNIGEELNKLEREAMECEREIARRLGCLALKDKIGDTISGVVSGVTEFGIFVEFDSTPTDGLARINDLGNDWYAYDEKRQRLVGQREGRIWHLGQPVEMRIESVNLDRLEIRLLPAGKSAVPSIRRLPRGKKTAGGSARRLKKVSTSKNSDRQCRQSSPGRSGKGQKAVRKPSRRGK